MSEPVTWQVMQAVAAALAQITVANGYRTNAGRQVLLEQLQGGPGSVERLCLYMDRAQLEALDLHGYQQWTMQLVVEGEVPSGRADAQARGHAVIADVFHRFPAQGVELAIPAGVADVSAIAADFLPRLDGANSSVAQIRLQAVVRLDID